MSLKALELAHFIQGYLSPQQAKTEETDCFLTPIHAHSKPIEPAKLNFHAVLLCLEGSCRAAVAHHDFTIQASTIAIIPPNTITSFYDHSADFRAQLLCFQADFVRKGFVKSDVMEELLLINPDFAPIFDLEESTLEDTLYKFQKIGQELENHAPFGLEMARLYLLQILYDYNRACELCLINSDKTLNRQFQVMYAFKKLVNEHFLTLKSVAEYADLMHLSPKYLSECVKNQANLSPIKIIQQRIILEAEFLLSYSQLSIKAISDQLGFPTASSFSRFFKTHKAISAAEYRAKP